MLCLLAPAKTLDLSPAPAPVEPTRPWFEADADELWRTLSALPPARLQRLMKLSPAKAREATRELASYVPGAPGVAAAHAYAGEVYRGLRGRDLGADELAWAQDRIAVLSGFYGLLRPLDGIQAHRLEMAARLPTSRGHNLYAFWGARITERIGQLLEGHGDRTTVDLASQEYLKAVWPRALPGRLLTVVFESWKDAARTPHPVPTHARHARGLMARFVVEHRIERAADLRAFALDGWAFVPDRSDDGRYVFGRRLPSP